MPARKKPTTTKRKNDGRADTLMPDSKKPKPTINNDANRADGHTNELPPPTSQRVIQFQTSLDDLVNQLDQLKAEYFELDSNDRKHIQRAQSTLESGLSSLKEGLSSAELLLSSGSTPKTYGLLNTITQPEIWATVFSFLSFPDFLRVSRVCRLWQEAALEPIALSSMEFQDDCMCMDTMSVVEVFDKYFRGRMDHVKVDNTSNSRIGQFLFWYMEWNGIRARSYRNVFVVKSYGGWEIGKRLPDERTTCLRCSFFWKGDYASIPSIPNLKTLAVPGSRLFDLEKCFPDLWERVTKLDTEEWSKLILKLKNLTALNCRVSILDAVNVFKTLGPKLKKLSIYQCYDANFKIISPASYIPNIEKLTISNTYYVSICNKLDKFTKLKFLHFTGCDGFKNQPITITSNSIQTLKIQSFNSITINCPNLEHLSFGPNNGSDMVQVNSMKLLTLQNARMIHILSIKGPNNLTRADFSRVKSITDLECPLLEKLIVDRFSVVRQNHACSKWINQIRYLKIGQGDDFVLDLLQTPNSIEVLSIYNWKIDTKITADSKYTMKNLRKLELTKVNLDTLTFFNDLFKSSTTLEDLTLDACHYGQKIMDSIANDYVNLKYLTFSELVGFNSSKAEAFCKGLKKQLKSMKLKVKTVSDTGRVFIPEGVESFSISNLVSCANYKPCEKLKRLDDSSSSQTTYWFDQLCLFPNLKFLRSSISNFEQFTDLVANLPNELEYLLVHCGFKLTNEMRDKSYVIASEIVPTFHISDGTDYNTFREME